MKSAIFLDRDGVINKKRTDYVKNIEEFEFLPNVFQAVKHMNDLGFLVIIITNQSIINRRIIPEKKLEEIHNYMKKMFEKNLCKITKIYHCPHRPDEKCICRKPNVGMLEQAVKDFKIDLSSSALIGDSITDIEAAKKMKIKSFLLKSNGDLLDIIPKLNES